MRSIETILGTLFSATMVRLGSMGIALYVGCTVGSKVIDIFTTTSAAFPTLP